MGAEFVRGRVCQGPSLLGAEMSRNPIKLGLIFSLGLHLNPYVLCAM